MPLTPNRRAGLLDLFAAIGMAGPVLMLVYSFGRRPAWMIVSIAALLGLAILVWVWWRRSQQKSMLAAATFAAIAVITMTLSDGVLYFGIIWTACLVLGITFSAQMVLWLYAAALVVIVIALHLLSGNSVEKIVTEAIGTAFFSGAAAMVAAVLRDSFRVAEELRDALARLDAANDELRRRLDSDRDLVLARERERTARELHDGLGHRLIAIGLALDYAARVDDQDAARGELRRARDMLAESLDAMRRLVRAMHPVELGELRDVEAFLAVAEAFRGTGIDIRVSVVGAEVAFPHEHSLLLLRFVQEGLTNVVRHSDATTVDLQVSAGAAGVLATIEDSGGRRYSDVPITEGFGLRSLRSRAHDLSGQLDAGPTPGGFRLALTLPARAAVPAVEGVR